MARRAANPTSRQPAAPSRNRGDPHIQPIAHAPLVFRIHVSAASVLSAMQPSTQLVHVFSAPAGYLKEDVRRGARIAATKPHGLLPVSAAFLVEGGVSAVGCGPRYDADLLVADGNPVADIGALARPAAVFAGGRRPAGAA